MEETQAAGLTAAGNTASLREQIDSKNIEQDQKISEAWTENARNLFMNLSTTHEEILQFIQDAANDPKASDAKMLALNTLINLRTQLVTLMSNAVRAMFDGVSSVIRNIRA